MGAAEATAGRITPDPRLDPGREESAAVAADAGSAGEAGVSLGEGGFDPALLPTLLPAGLLEREPFALPERLLALDMMMTAPRCNCRNEGWEESV